MIEIVILALILAALVVCIALLYRIVGMLNGNVSEDHPGIVDKIADVWRTRMNEDKRMHGKRYRAKVWLNNKVGSGGDGE